MSLDTSTSKPCQMLYITRKQLKEQGASQYLAVDLTKRIEVLGKQGRSNLYSIDDVLTEAESKLAQKRIRLSTRLVLGKLVKWLKSNQDSTDKPDNVVSFGQHLAISRGEDASFLADIEENIKKMREARDKFRSIVQEASQVDPNAFTKI